MLDPSLSLKSAIQTMLQRMTQLLNYATAVAPCVKQNPELMTELSESAVLLMAARLDAFLATLVSLGAQCRERTVRKQLWKDGNEVALSCETPDLVKLVRDRVSYKKGGKRLNNLFHLILGCSVWPSDKVRDDALDLVLLRNMIVHGDGRDWSQDGVRPAEYASQFRRHANLLRVSRYGDLVTYCVDPGEVLPFIKDAALNIIDEIRYLDQRLVLDTSWTKSDGLPPANDSVADRS